MTAKEVEAHIYELNEQIIVNRVIVNTLIDIIVNAGIKELSDVENEINERLDKFRQQVKKRSEEIKKTENKKSGDKDFDRLFKAGVRLGEA